MNVRFRIALLVACLGMAGAASADPVWTINSLDTIGCNSDDTGFSTFVSGYTGGNIHYRTIVDAGGLRYMDEDAGTISNGSENWHLYTSNSGGPTTAAWPIPPDTPITVNFDFIDGPGGPIVFDRKIVLSQCNGGTITSNTIVVGTGVTNVSIPTLGAAPMIATAVLLSALAFAGLRRRG